MVTLFRGVIVVAKVLSSRRGSVRDYLANIEFDRYVWRVMKISFEDGILFS